MKKLFALLSALSVLTASAAILPLNVCAEDKETTPTVEERTAEGFARYESELALSKKMQKNPVPRKEILSKWTSYIAAFMEEYKEAAKQAGMLYEHTAAEGTANGSDTEEFLEIFGPAMPAATVEAIQKGPGEYTLFYLGDIVLCMHEITCLDDMSGEEYQIAEIEVIPLNLKVVLEWDKNAVESLTVTQPLLTVFDAIDANNQSIAQIESFMTEDGLWNIKEEQEDLHSPFFDPERISQDNTYNYPAIFKDLKKIYYNLASGNDTYTVTNQSEPVFAIIGETGKGQSGDDTLEYAYDVKASDLIFFRLNDNLYVSDEKNETYVRIDNYFAEAGKCIEHIRFQDGTVMNYDDICSRADVLLGNAKNNELNGYLQASHLYGLAGDDTLYGNKGVDVLLGFEGNDTLTLADGAFGGMFWDTSGNYVYGMDGNDTIRMGNGDDFIIGGKGDDTIHSGNGRDILYYALGDGNDIITDLDSENLLSTDYDVLVLGEGIRPADVRISVTNKKYLMKFAGADGSITFNSENNDIALEEIRFADGTVWGNAEVRECAKTLYATDGDDTLKYELNQDSVIYGLAGNDNITGNDKVDTFYCGAGDDIFNGVGGDDIYIYNIGDGCDTLYDHTLWGEGHNTLRFGKGIQKSDLYYEEVKVDNVKYARFYVENRSAYVQLNGIHEIHFADGTVTTPTELAKAVQSASVLPSDRKYTHSLSLSNNLSINFYVSAEDILDMSSIALEVYNPRTQKTDTLKGTLTTLNGSKQYKFTYKGIAAAYAGDKVTATLVGKRKDGSAYRFNSDAYSVAQYCADVLEKSNNAKMKTLIVDLLNYCAATQKYADSSIAGSKLVNANLTAAQKALATQGKLSLNSIESNKTLKNATASFTAKSILVGNQISLKYYFDLSKVKNVKNVTVVLKRSNTEKKFTYADFGSGRTAGEYTLTYSDIPVIAFSDPIEAVIYENGKAISGTLIYSVESYAAKVQTSVASSNALKVLVDAMMRYSISAKAYSQN